MFILGAKDEKYSNLEIVVPNVFLFFTCFNIGSEVTGMFREPRAHPARYGRPGEQWCAKAPWACTQQNSIHSCTFRALDSVQTLTRHACMPAVLHVQRARTSKLINSILSHLVQLAELLRSFASG